LADSLRVRFANVRPHHRSRYAVPGSARISAQRLTHSLHIAIEGVGPATIPLTSSRDLPQNEHTMESAAPDPMEDRSSSLPSTRLEPLQLRDRRTGARANRMPVRHLVRPHSSGLAHRGLQLSKRSPLRHGEGHPTASRLCPGLLRPSIRTVTWLDETASIPFRRLWRSLRTRSQDFGAEKVQRTIQVRISGVTSGAIMRDTSHAVVGSRSLSYYA
jgi:hypothetical protein